MLTDRRTHRRLWLAAAGLALVVSAVGLLRPAIYRPVTTERILPGVLSQDAVTVLVSLVILGLAARLDADAGKRQLVCLAGMGFLFYASGIYVIEQLYTPFYPGYMAVFGLSAYAIVYGLMRLDPACLRVAALPRRPRLSALVLLSLTPAIFYPLWLSQLLPLLGTGTRLTHLYSIYILDLCLIMPAFAIVAYRLYHRRGLGAAFAPVLFLVGFAVLVPLPIAELLRPTVTGAPVETASLGLFSVLSATYLWMAAVTLRALRLPVESGLVTPEAGLPRSG